MPINEHLAKELNRNMIDLGLEKQLFQHFFWISNYKDQIKMKWCFPLLAAKINKTSIADKLCSNKKCLI